MRGWRDYDSSKLFRPRRDIPCRPPEPAISQPFFTSDLFVDPYPGYHRLRSEAPAYLDRDTRELVLTRYADVVAALKNPRLSSRRVADGYLVLPSLMRRLAAPVVRTLTRQMLFSDPPDHTRLRGLASKAFTPRAVEATREQVQRRTERLLKGLARRREADFMGAFAAQLPIIVIADLLGVPSRHRRAFKTWSDDLALFIGGTTLSPHLVMLRGARGVLSLRLYFRWLVRQRRRKPGENLLDALIAAEERGDQLTEEELLANAMLILAAGHETTTNLLGNGLLALFRHPEQMELLRRQPEGIESAVEELLRFDSPVQWTGRVATEDLQVNEVRIRAGQHVALCLGAANRDPDQFAEPDRLDLRREENRHVAFGHGVHFCLGAALARMEGQVAFRSLLAQFPALRLAGEPEWLPNFTLRGLKRLPIALQ